MEADFKDMIGKYLDKYFKKTYFKEHIFKIYHIDLFRLPYLNNLKFSELFFGALLESDDDNEWLEKRKGKKPLYRRTFLCTVMVLEIFLHNRA